ncbi:hypothetical protein GJW-30_1_01686 [Variibacter gotjawalensis]|uniref:Uncharacterized protein n=1 Tax=Variibacter gotjawalensis TaxID=1333996 RepID=A0A0S3PTF2_9BRAD|nr:hypothetical protein [Variibacter gotjawalensis]NIK49471.1 hypothetical protein [Variibacter gotjawalensis]RZS51323.1 hypothetical protein EV661_3801 [Variibacter gotjawalensis]BAT59156.1 hypothetical protein GJW-30_1_01686 [Variibacter gotjawalensis]
MPDDVKAARISEMAAADHIPLRPDAAARIARAITPTVTRFHEEKMKLEMEVEPSTFVVVSMREIKQ